MNLPLLSLITFLPLVGILLVLLVPKTNDKLVKQVSLATVAVDLLLVVGLAASFKTGTAAMQFVEKASWIPSMGIQYYMGVDGISLPMVVITALLGFVAMLASWNINTRVKEYFALLLFLQVGMLGVFTALDYILFYVFWEIVLLPMYFLIAIWGGPRREYAAIKFFIYTLLGSVFMLVGILALYFKAGIGSFDMLALAKVTLPLHFQYWVFLAFFFGFAVKVPMFPFHTWLPDAHVEAPTAVSVILAGVLLKMGVYGIIRVNMPTFPQAMEYFAPALAVFAIINILYGAMVAMVQKDLKKLVAYSSVSHMGYCLLGISALTATGVNGAVFQMFSHGLITGMLFLLVGVIYERTHTRQIAGLGGLFVTVPVIATITAFASFASLGLPSLSGFVAEFMTLLGSYEAYKVIVALAAVGIVITAGYLLWMMQRVLLGEERSEYKGMADASVRDMVTLVPLMALIVYLGINPDALIRVMNASVMKIVGHLGGM